MNCKAMSTTPGLRMAEIYDELDNKRRADALRKKAAELFKKFNEIFWDEKSASTPLPWMPRSGKYCR